MKNTTEEATSADRLSKKSDSKISHHIFLNDFKKRKNFLKFDRIYMLVFLHLQTGQVRIRLKPLIYKRTVLAEPFPLKKYPV